MGNISLQTKATILLLPCFFLSVICLNISQNQLISLPPLPIVSNLPPLPLVPDLLNFLDQRIASLFQIIQTFKNTITLDPLDITNTWVGPNICKYKGFYCDNPPDNHSATALASIDFNGFQLSAPTIDGFIDKLPDLALFHANSNKFSGPISSKIANLTYLYELDLSNNNFNGDFPIAILGLPFLSFLDIRYNSFTGSLPPQLFMQTLDVLFLNNNNFMQELPENLGLTPARYLTLANNKFTGPIPRSIANASSTLTEILLLNNSLNGCLPYELGFLKELVLFDASNNLLTGPLPCSLGCLTKIEQLNLAGNLLYGQVPEVLCALGNLANLSLSRNYFTKLGPLCGKLVKRGVLDVRNNCIPGLPYQRSAQDCAGFFKQRRSCPYPESFNFVPCKVPQRSTLNLDMAQPKRKLVSYGALLRHKAM